MTRRLRKFKITSSTEEISMCYEKENEHTGTWDEFTLRSGEPPLMELRNALAGMVDHVIDICELPDEMRPFIKVLSVSISFADNIQGLVITSMRTLKGSNGPMIINTPHFSAKPYSETADPFMSILSKVCVKDLATLEEAVFDYVDGKRAQVQLNFGAAKDDSGPGRMRVIGG